MDLKKEIIAGLKKVVKDLTDQEVEIKLEQPVEESHGDYSSNIALTSFKDKGLRIKDKKIKTPLDLAQIIAEKLNHSSLILNHCEKVEAVKPGFINFWISKEYLIENLSKPLEFGNGLKNKKVMVEFTDPNPFKEFHIGHLYSNIVGESFSRLLAAQGAEVRRVCYQGDIGLHVAKAIWGILKQSQILKQVQDDTLEKKAKFLGDAYALGSKVYEEDENAKKEIQAINKKVYDQDPEILDLYRKGREWSLEKFNQIYERLGTKFERFYFESEMGKIGVEIVKKYLKEGIFEESDGAIIFKGEKYGLHTRVFINALGLPTYEAKDLALAPTKYKEFPYDLSIIITANEQSEYFKVVLKALNFIEKDIANKTKHIGHGMVRLPSGKMSSRTGNVITGEWLLDKAKELISNQFPEMDKVTLEKVGVGAVKYALLKTGIGRNIEFNFEESISFEGNSGPYLQYTFARTCSVFAKLKSQNSKVKITNQNSKVQNEIEPAEFSLLRALSRFPEVVEEAGKNYAPNLLCNYLFDLSQKFNLFYQKHKILESENQEFRLMLTKSVGQVLKTGLNLLGIQAPEKM